MNEKQYIISAVWWNQGKKMSYEFKDEKHIYQMTAAEFESKLTSKNYIG